MKSIISGPVVQFHCVIAKLSPRHRRSLLAGTYLCHPPTSNPCPRPWTGTATTPTSTSFWPEPGRAVRATSTTWSWTTGRRPGKPCCRRCPGRTGCCWARWGRIPTGRGCWRRQNVRPRRCCSSRRATTRASKVRACMLLGRWSWLWKCVNVGVNEKSKMFPYFSNNLWATPKCNLSEFIFIFGLVKRFEQTRIF